ncbi:hypothetical protein HAL07_04680 [Helicobacter ailurogastricus]|uniref:Transmembrane protein n=1 Tax=Helicobacter ailurogastricus TaxID=1578720 RepID=A0A0K2Y1Z7_9HELI|nr:hypothetical protein HAL07_04680 [Helicobacter ailurogastricus]
MGDPYWPSGLIVGALPKSMVFFWVCNSCCCGCVVLLVALVMLEY